MLKNLTKTIVCLVSLVGLIHCSNKKHEVADIQKYKVTLPESLIKAAGGFMPAIGSSLEFSKKLSDGSIEFYAISDRGPNYPLKDFDSKVVVFNPQFSPMIARVVVKPGDEASVKDFMEIKYQGEKISGLNLNQSSADEEFYDKNFTRIKPVFGLDSESISILKNGNFVIGDEYYPSINIVDRDTGEIIKTLTPGDGLPEILKHRNFNRGFESITVAPNGKIYAMLEGTLNIDSQSNKNAQLVRLIEVDLDNSITKTYAYKFDYEKYKNSDKVKIGDITALDDQNFLLVEQGPGKEGEYHNVIYKINIKDASDISSLKLEDGKELEHLAASELKHINFVTKEYIFNPREYGWTQQKLEGVAIVDPKTIAITNDTDFGIDGYTLQNEPCDTQKSCSTATPNIDPEKHQTNLWIIKFKEKL